MALLRIIQNRAFDETKGGDTASLVRTLTRDDVEDFAMRGAAALCKMVDRKQITGGILDGPRAFDNAISEEAARLKGIESAVAGRANILIVPDLESGNMLAKQLEYLGDAQLAGLVLGARVPIVLTSRADDPPARMASCAIALLFARRGPKY
jgi:phosphate acetyltransferase